MRVEKERMVWIDLLKGFLLCFVVLGHYRENIPIPGISDFLHFMRPWRVPTYFFISGFLFSTNRFSSFKEFFLWKSKTILLPYLSFSILFLIIDWNLYLTPIATLKDSLYRIFILGNSTPKAGPMWFVFVLYMLSIIQYPISKLKYKIEVLIVLIILSVLSWYSFTTSIVDVFSFKKIFSCIPFFSLGFLMKKQLNVLLSISFKKRIIISITLFLLFYYFNNVLKGGMFWENSNNFLSFYLPSFLGILAITILFSIFNTKNCFNKFLIIISKNALVILGTHGFILIVQELIFRNYIDLNSYVFFYFRTIMLIVLEILSIYICNKYLYFFLGKKQKNFKESFS